jgi:hypothetical protein
MLSGRIRSSSVSRRPSMTPIQLLSQPPPCNDSCQQRVPACLRGT